MSDNVKNPSHYNRGKIEVWEFIEDQGFDYQTGNAVKYIVGAVFKDPSKEVEDLQKAIAFLDRKIKVLEGTTNVNTKITNFLDFTETLTSKQREFLENKFNVCANMLSAAIDNCIREETMHAEKECIKWFHSMLTYSSLIKCKPVQQKVTDLFKELKDIGIF